VVRPKNVNMFMVQAMGLKFIASRSSWMVSSAYQFSWKSTNQFKSY